MMKKILLFILLLIGTANFLAAQDTLVIYYDKDWEETVNIADAAFYRKAYPDSDKMYSVRDYYINGKIQMTGSFKTMKMKAKQGYFVYYGENGARQSEGMYVDDKCEGTWNLWHENGQKKSEGIFKNGKREGVWKSWNEFGQFNFKQYYSLGKIYQFEGFFANGQMRFQLQVGNNEIPLSGIYWSSDGRLIMKGKFSYGERDGEWVRKFSTGEMVIHYDNGQILGKPLGGMVRKQ